MLSSDAGLDSLLDHTAVRRQVSRSSDAVRAKPLRLAKQIDVM
jgi:hypothetical protein